MLQTQRFYLMTSRLFAVAIFVGMGVLASSQARASLEDEGWEVVSKNDGIITHRREIEGSSLVEFRGEAVLDASLAKVASVLLDTPRKLEWVNRIREAKNIREYSDVERIEYNHTAAPWPVKDRDFVFHAWAEADVAARTLRIRLKSVEDEKMSEQACCVRGELLNSAYTLRALAGDTKTNIVVQVHADPKGFVPKWIVNLIQKSWPRKTLEALRAQVAKPDVVEHAYYRSLFFATPEQVVSGVKKEKSSL